MSRVSYSSFAALAILLITIFATTTTVSAVESCVGGCLPWSPNGCKSGQNMKLRFIIDASEENSALMLENVSWNQVGYGFCPVVDQLQAFKLPNASAWAAANLKQETFGSNATNNGFYNATPAYIRIFGATGLQDGNNYIPRNSYDSAALLFDPKQTCTDERGAAGFLITNFLVVNFTLTNGKYRLIDSFNQPIQVGFQPTCDKDDVCQIDPSHPCLGNTTGKKNCAVCITSFDDIIAPTRARTPKLQFQIFASYYGTDVDGRRLTSGASNPLNFLALSGQGVFNAVSDDINKAYNTVKTNV